MIQEQVLNKILTSQDSSFIDKNSLTEDNFPDYVNEFNFIKQHIAKYKNVPDKQTFLAKYPNFEIINVKESDDYLLHQLSDETAYNQIRPIYEKSAELMNVSTRDGVEYLLSNLKNVQFNTGHTGIDIIKTAKDRYDTYLKLCAKQKDSFYATGFTELDELIHGFRRGEEFVAIFARTGTGKSWLSEKFAMSIWEQGGNVGYFSPEMTATTMGYRFDTLRKHYNNSSLAWGTKLPNENEYKEYVDELSKNKTKLLVSVSSDFGNKVTVSKLRQWVKNEKLDALFVDGITYVTDERRDKGDNKTQALTDIAEDLMSLSVELHIPVFSISQAKRKKEDADAPDTGAPELDEIMWSDGIAHNASTAFSLRQKDSILDIKVVKSRSSRTGNTLHYSWDINHGTFEYVPSKTDGLNNTDKVIEDNNDKFKEDSDIVF